VKTRAAILGQIVGFILATGVGSAASDLNDAGMAAYSRGDYVAASAVHPGWPRCRDPLLHYHRA
jgi:hypothetical protein